MAASTWSLDPVAAQDTADDPAGLRQIGTMVRPHDPLLRPMSVDEHRNLGFVANRVGSTVDLMDLERLARVDDVADDARQLNGSSPESSLAIDTRRERIYAMPGKADLASGVCDRGPSNVVVYDYRENDGLRQMDQDFLPQMPCTGPMRFFGATNTYDYKHDRLYVGGVATSEAWRSPPEIGPVPSLAGGPFQEDRGQALLVRQLAMRDGPLVLEPGGNDPARQARFVLEWEIDLRMAGCGRREQVASNISEGFVARLGNEVIAYCWDGRPYRGLQAGQQGYLVRIPLTPDPTNREVMRPLTSGEPVIDPATKQIVNYVYRRIPTLPGKVTVLLDEVSGRVMLVTTGETNGNAVWVFDPRAERFVGVVTGGYADQPPGNSAVGFDRARGRVYVLTQQGILIAPIRLDPLPAGLIYPVLVNEARRDDFVTSSRISVAPKLGRLFVAMNDYNGDRPDHYAVLEDAIPDPPRVQPIDPDSLTIDVQEREGATTRSTSGRAIASGVHLVNAGGLPRLVGQNDPSCSLTPPNLQIPAGSEAQDPVPDWELGPALLGSCLSEIAVAGGHREGAAGAAEVDVSNGGGATARGSAFAFGSADVGTDGDIRRMSGCAAETPDSVNGWARRWPFPEEASLNGATNQPQDNPKGDQFLRRDQQKKDAENQLNDGRDAFWDGVVGSDQFQKGREDYRGGCNQLQDGVAEGSGQTPAGPVDVRSGTKGPDGRGFPVRAAVCGDFGGSASSETSPELAAGQPQAVYPTSSVSCDAAVPGAQSTATAGALSLPSAADPQLTVARVSSRVTSVRTSEGQVTVAFASASGVQIGPLSIAEIRSLAITKAAGRKGTTSAVLLRQWCGVAVAGQTQEGCVDATSQQVKDLLDELSAALLQKVQFSVPEGETQATPGGYQAVVTKHPGQRGADQTVNDDDSHTVSALQVILYNDGPRGRSRLIVQLAGVHAESRYGIIELPNFSTGPGGQHTPPPAQPDPGPAPTTDPAPASDPGPAAGPLPPTFTPESFVDEVFTEEVVRTNGAPPAPRFIDVPDGGSPAERIVRVPIKALSDAINLLVQHPREFAMLFLLFSLLATPLYLGSRRRSFARALVST